MEYLVEISSKINLTEDPEKVKKSILNIFPKGNIQQDSDKLFLRGNKELLNNFKKTLEKREIISVARLIMDNNIKDNVLTFYISKQTAFVNEINFSEGNSPLGDIQIKIESSNLEEVLNWLAPEEFDEF
ncbi:MAG: RNA-binding domain-containing protein [Methanobacteriaceae archaeon]|nr:RNA-binding domain-containing protein [Methanobacteriaceae archaeon]